MELSTGGVIDAWSMDTVDPARGRKYARVVLDEDEATETSATLVTGGGLLSLADMLVAETEFNLDQTGLDATLQPHAAQERDEREALLSRFDIRHMVSRTAELYEELVREQAE